MTGGSSGRRGERPRALAIFCLVAVLGAVVVSAGVAGAVGSGPAGAVGSGPAGAGSVVAGDDGSPVAPQTGSEGASDRVPLTGCFAGDGYPLSIGNGSATIDGVVHASVLTDPGAGDEFGVELAGALDRTPIVTLAAGVRLDAPGLVATGADPFAAFDVLYTYEFRLPMFDGTIDDSTYREDRPPVGSAAGTAAC